MNTSTNRDGRHVCELRLTLDDLAQEAIRCEGQTEKHAIAIALEQLASHYRQAAEAQQNLDWDAVEQSAAGEAIAKHYHVILHYERRAEEISKFEALQNTIMGNTVVENADIAIIEIDADAQIEPLAKQWDD
ncbi:hypothetical protein [Leptolyngbya sp. BC1307]|uniref:hypothetical protein n=1 Tax=Leptolyngbya sp. BC1307 TaxID=2029589 RepID=UPI001F0AA1DF|nr:hypothetical protein [Leptolyngbya sp. BC1307]